MAQPLPGPCNHTTHSVFSTATGHHQTWLWEGQNQRLREAKQLTPRHTANQPRKVREETSPQAAFWTKTQILQRPRSPGRLKPVTHISVSSVLSWQAQAGGKTQAASHRCGPCLRTSMSQELGENVVCNNRFPLSQSPIPSSWLISESSTGQGKSPD